MSKRVSNRLGIWKALVFSVVVCTLVILRLPMDCSTPLAFHPLRLTRIQRTREYEPDVESIAPSNVHLKRVAIIGGGAAGTSFSYFMQKLLPEAVLTLYEASARIGGRAKLANINIPKELIGWTGNVTSIPVEVGASIFVTVNEHLYKLAQEFGLNFTDGDNRNISPSKVPPVGIYDGEKFVYKASTSTWKSIGMFISYLCSAKYLVQFRRYGGGAFFQPRGHDTSHWRRRSDFQALISSPKFGRSDSIPSRAYSKL